MELINLRGDQTYGNVIGSSMLGGEYLGWTGFPGWQIQAEAVGIQHIRWPAGNIAEDRQVDGSYAYDISTTNIVDNWPLWNGNPRPGITEMFEYARSVDASFSMIIPTGRYVELAVTDMQSTRDWIQSDISTFTTRLFAGEFGQLPDKLVLEVGAEYYSTDAWQNNSDLENIDEIFAEVFAEVVNALSAEEQIFGLDVFSVAVQMGRFQSNDDTDEIRDGEAEDSAAFISAYQSNGVADYIDSAIWHRYVYTYDQIAHHLSLPGSNAYGSEETLHSQLEYWSQQINNDLSLVVGWASPDVDSEGEFETNPFFDYGPRSGANLLQMFSSLVASGADIGTIYGIDSPWLGAISTGGQAAEEYDVFFSGSVFNLLSESVVGTSAVVGFENNFVEVDTQNNVVESTNLNVNAFVNEAKLVTFVSAGNLPPNGVTTTLDSDFDSNAKIVRVTKATPSSQGNDAMASINDIVPPIDPSGAVQFDLNSDFEIARVEQFKELTDEMIDSEHAIFSSVFSDSFLFTYTNGGENTDVDDELESLTLRPEKTVHSFGAGNDDIIGSDQSATIIGGAGNDSILGGDGAELIYGDNLGTTDLTILLDL